MSWDLALSPYQDLIFSANRDLQYVDGVALVNQRIITRLQIIRGTWLFDDSATLGSRLDLVLAEDQVQGPPNIEGLVREALEPIRDEIEIENIDVSLKPLGQVLVTVDYIWLTPSVAPFSQDLQRLAIVLPTGGA